MTRGEGFVIAALLLSLEVSTHAIASVYRCLGPSGIDVYTDSPAAFQSCTVFTEDPPLLISAPSGQDVIITPPSKPPPIVRPPSIVPLHQAGQLFLIDTTINGHRAVRLILDTGASHTILSTAVARDLGYEPHAGTQVTLKTAAGPVQVKMVRVASVHLAEEEIQDVPIAIHDLSDAPSGVDGLLGMSVLSQFVVTIDTQKGQLRLQRRE